VKRGEVWRYHPVIAREGQSTTRLVVSADPLNADPSVPTIYVAHVINSDPGSLLAVRIDDFGWALTTRIDRPPRSRLVEQLGTATTDEMDQVSTALRATFEL
jgi:mRNA-degrading endonuclease toxin of MazEF toxin-antitoxin module